MVAAARAYLEKTRSKPLDARYKVERTKDGYEVFAMFVAGYEKGRPLYTPGGHGTVFWVPMAPWSGICQESETMAEPNKITGANAGGSRPLAIRTLWAARIAQFRR